jgi:putative ABC transport system permease protein
MLKNYFKIAFRNLWRNKLYSFINLLGLSTALTACGLIVLFILDESSYDNFHQNEVYRIDWLTERPQTRTPHPMTLAMMKDFPEVKSAVSITPIWGSGLTRQTFVMQYGERRFEEKELLAVDTTFFEVFTFPAIRGNAHLSLQDPNAIIISQKIAQKYFGLENPIGKILRINDNSSLRVSAVLKDVPANSHFHFDFLVSYLRLKKQESGDFFQWGDFGHYNYVALQPNTNPQLIEQKIPKWIRSYLNWPAEDLKALETGIVKFKLSAIQSIHLHSHLLWELETNGNINYLYIFGSAALLILLIALVNYINLATALIFERSKQVGLRKLIGANNRQIIQQFLTESTVLLSIAFLLSVSLLELILPIFNQYTNKTLKISYLDGYGFLLIFLAIVGILGLLMGWIPAWHITTYKPIDVLKKQLKSGKMGIRIREGLVIFQFMISITLIISTFVIYSQIEHLKNRPLGFEQHQIIVVPIKDKKMRQTVEAVRGNLLKNANFKNVTTSSNIPFGQFNQQEIRWQKNQTPTTTSLIDVDYDFFKTLNIKVLKGRVFDKSFSEDTQETTFILNETAAKQFAWQNPINQPLTILEDNGDEPGKVIGVVKDFHFQSLHEKITPMVFRIRPNRANYYLIKIDHHQVAQSLQFLEKTWKQWDNRHTFEYSFLDERMQSKYQAEVRMGGVFGVFSGLAIGIAGIGLFGLASFLMVQRTKEIGIRKVLGAGVLQIVLLLSQNFLRLVLIAFVLATPLAYYLLQKWLQEFVYRVSITWWAFLIAGVLAMFIALITIAYQVIWASLTNPVEVLKNE